MITRLALRYDAALKRRPLLVKAGTSGLLNSACDTTLQWLQNAQRKEQGNAPQPWNPLRTCIFGAAYGLAWYGPFMHLVTTTWGRVLPCTQVSSLAFKAVFDVCTSFPINLCMVIGLQASIRGDDPRVAVRSNLWPSWCAGACFWPAANMVVYRVPVIYRVFCLNIFSYSWNCFMLWSAFDFGRENWIEKKFSPSAKSAGLLRTLTGPEGSGGMHHVVVQTPFAVLQGEKRI